MNCAPQTIIEYLREGGRHTFEKVRHKHCIQSCDINTFVRTVDEIAVVDCSSFIRNSGEYITIFITL